MGQVAANDEFLADRLGQDGEAKRVRLSRQRKTLAREYHYHAADSVLECADLLAHNQIF